MVCVLDLIYIFRDSSFILEVNFKIFNFGHLKTFSEGCDAFAAQVYSLVRERGNSLDTGTPL